MESGCARIRSSSKKEVWAVEGHELKDIRLLAIIEAKSVVLQYASPIARMMPHRPLTNTLTEEVTATFTMGTFTRTNRAHHEGSTHVADARHGLHRELAEQRQHEVLQQAVLEHPHGGRRLPMLQRPTAKPVLHWRPHLHRRDCSVLN